MYQRIHDDLATAIAMGQYKVGDRLPSEKELAAQYGVSRITCTNALNLLQEKGYVDRHPGRGTFVLTNQLGMEDFPERNPSGTGSRLVGVVITDFSDSFGAEILRGIEREASSAGLFCILRMTGDSVEKESRILADLMALDLAGLLISPAHGEAYNPKILQMILRNFPVVLVDRDMKGMGVSFVGTDNIRAAAEATSRLFDAGHRQIGFLSAPPAGSSSLEDRMAGFLKVYAEQDVRVNRNLWITDIESAILAEYNQEALEADVRRIRDLLAANPDMTAIFATEYRVARMAVKAAELAGRRVPETLSVLCFDAPPEFLEGPRVSFMRQQERKIGMEAVRLLVDSIRNGAKGERRMIDARFVDGGSIGIINDI